MSPTESQEDEALFEAEVLRVCRALFSPEQQFSGSAYLDGAERDGLFVGEDIVVLVEATVSGRLDKAQKDGDKLKAGCARLAKQYRFKAVKGYFVTRNEPTVDQRHYIEGLGGNIIACSLAQLRSTLIDTREYLTLREKYAFGSARNPQNGSATDLDAYLQIGLLPHESQPSSSILNSDDIATRTNEGLTTIVLGDFGAGKSMTIREVHRKLAANHFKTSSTMFPMTLNLRDHQGQKEPDEAIRRHAAMLGFPNASRLVRAWRAGEVHVLLDGFDEIATTGWLGQAIDLKQIRRRSVELIRKFVEQTPTEAGIVITGRRHLFDSVHEMSAALGLSQRAPLTLLTDQFSEDQVSKYLSSHGWSGALPGWLPSRPLLLGYLATSGAIESLAESSSDSGPAEGWNTLLDRVCEREATMEVGVDGATVRLVLERLATIARTRIDGMGPILQNDLATAFEQACGYAPDEGSYLLLQRMPGMGVIDPSDGSRHLIDASLADAARAGDVVRYVSSSGVDNVIEELQGSVAPLGALGVGVAEVIATAQGLSGPQAAAMANRLQGKGAHDALVLDASRLALALGGTDTWPVLHFSGLMLEEVAFADEAQDLGAMKFTDCLIDSLDLTEFDGDHSLPVFERTAFGVVLGVGSSAALPKGHFVDCSFDQFDPSSKTTRGILATPGLSGRQRVLLSIVKKVYLQAGSGRKHSALVRGLDDKLKLLVPDVLEMLISEGLVVKGKLGSTTLYFPVRGSTARIRRMLETGVSSADELLISAR